MVQWDGEDWSKPVNLADTVNTAGNKMFPWFSPGNTLYFASNGHPGLGGLDIFSSQRSGQATFAEPKNLGAPINSSMDDFQIVFTEGKQSGYFSSNRLEGKGDDDIYSFMFRPVKYKGLVVDKVTQEPIDRALVQMSDEYFVDEVVGNLKS